MKNYKALKSADKVSVAKVKVVDQDKQDEVRDDDGFIVKYAREEVSHEELRVVKKVYNSSTGEVLDDSITSYNLNEVARNIAKCKSDISIMQAEKADLEQLEKDLKAL